MNQPPKLTGGEVLVTKNSKLQTKNFELLHRINALNTDKDELIRENTHLRNRNEELVNEKNQLEANNIQIHAANENLTRLNTVLRTVLRDAEDERDHYKAGNLEEFNNFI